ncbi:MAG: molybdopterin-dependent oxidoreductase [Candidatus Aminicenantes bacterium]|nr:molybdopterin-dependent oxidoreductase [Candidatus Aminicenantes bacterium]
MSLKRRDFLKIAGGISLSLPLYNCALDKLSDSTQQNSWLSGIESWIPTVCQACPGGCGIFVRVVDDRAVKIEGNPIHPLNRGRVCPRGQAGLQVLYSPERIKSPMKKVGRRDSRKWEIINWEEAINAVSSRLLELRNSEKSHTIAFMGQNSSHTTEDLITRFLKVYGTPNYIKLDDWTTLKKAYHLTQGIHDLLALDLENSKYVLSFGADFLTNWPTSMENQRIYGEKRSKRNIKIVQAEPRFSLCASRADKWIPINPGTEGLLAIGIASVIVKEKLYNERYLDRFALQFEDWIDDRGIKQKGFKSAILGEVRLDHISDVTGVPLRTIIEVAKEFSSTQPAVAVADYNLSFQTKGLFSVLAIHSLNALIGNIDSPGGLLRQRRAPLGDMPPVKLDKRAERGMSQPRIDGVSGNELTSHTDGIEKFCENILNKDPYEINCLFLSNNSLNLSSPISKKVKEALKNIPFIVSFSSFLDDANSFADIILPDSSFFEKWQESQVSPMSKIPIVGICQPAVKPLYQSKPFDDVILTLAKKMGSPISQNFPWSSFKELLLDRLKGLFEAKRGSVFTSPPEEEQLRLLEERGWWVPQHASSEAFMKGLLEKGGWQDPSYHFNERSYIYQTPSRKFEFFSLLKTQEIHPEFSGDENEYPFILYLYDLPFNSDFNGVNMPWHQETIGFRFNLGWHTWVEINPETAKKLNIQDKELVWVESPYGKIKVIVKIFSGIIPHVVSIPLGKEEDVPGQKNARKIIDPLVLIGETHDVQTGVLSRQSTRVKIYKSGRSGNK